MSGGGWWRGWKKGAKQSQSGAAGRCWCWVLHCALLWWIAPRLGQTCQQQEAPLDAQPFGALLTRRSAVVRMSHFQACHVWPGQRGGILRPVRAYNSRPEHPAGRVGVRERLRHGASEGLQDCMAHCTSPELILRPRPWRWPKCFGVRDAEDGKVQNLTEASASFDVVISFSVFSTSKQMRSLSAGQGRQGRVRTSM